MAVAFPLTGLVHMKGLPSLVELSQVELSHCSVSWHPALWRAQRTAAGAVQLSLYKSQPHTAIAVSLQHCQQIDDACLCTAAHNFVAICKSLASKGSPPVTCSG